MQLSETEKLRIKNIVENNCPTRAAAALGISTYKITKLAKEEGWVFAQKYPQVHNTKVFFSNIRSVNKQDLEEYYVTQNHSKIATAEHFKITFQELTYAIIKLKIKKPSALSNLLQKQTMEDKYGSKSYNNLAKMQQTCLERYGVQNMFENVDYIKQSYIKKLGATHPMHVAEIKEKQQKTMERRYGSRFYTCTDVGKAKSRQTCIEHLGVPYPMLSEKVKAKYDWSAIGQKIFETKKRNGTCNTSKIQKSTGQCLRQIFGEQDIFEEYKDINRYPFHCDFYIKSLDIFIELNLYFTHGFGGREYPPHLYTADDPRDISLREKWQAKAQHSKFYSNALYVWTVLDPLKMRTALTNQLHYICLYTESDVRNFIDYCRKYINNSEEILKYVTKQLPSAFEN